jgi:hypothetical protein
MTRLRSSDRTDGLSRSTLRTPAANPSDRQSLATRVSFRPLRERERTDPGDSRYTLALRRRRRLGLRMSSVVLRAPGETCQPNRPGVLSAPPMAAGPRSASLEA